MQLKYAGIELTMTHLCEKKDTKKGRKKQYQDFGKTKNNTTTVCSNIVSVNDLLGPDCDTLCS